MHLSMWLVWIFHHQIIYHKVLHSFISIFSDPPLFCPNSIKIQTFHHEFPSLFQLLRRFSVRAGGLNIAAVFHIVDAGVCHEALVMLPNNLIKKQDITGSCFHTMRKMLVSSCWYKRREKSFWCFFFLTHFFLLIELSFFSFASCGLSDMFLPTAYCAAFSGFRCVYMYVCCVKSSIQQRLQSNTMPVTDKVCAFDASSSILLSPCRRFSAFSLAVCCERQLQCE